MTADGMRQYPEVGASFPVQRMIEFAHFRLGPRAGQDDGHERPDAFHNVGEIVGLQLDLTGRIALGSYGPGLLLLKEVLATRHALRDICLHHLADECDFAPENRIDRLLRHTRFLAIVAFGQPPARQTRPAAAMRALRVASAWLARKSDR